MVQRNDTLSPVILYLASDLLWATRIKATAEDLGLAARPVRSLDMLEARLKDTEPTGVILDLAAAEAAMEILGRLRGPAAGDRERAIRIVAFAPHVKTELMAAAEAGGADRVLARGAFDRTLPQVLRGLTAPAA
jgi:hypothetical protein